MPDPGRLILLDTDLFFVVKVRTTLQHAGYEVQTARTVDGFYPAAGGGLPSAGVDQYRYSGRRLARGDHCGASGADPRDRLWVTRRPGDPAAGASGGRYPRHRQLEAGHRPPRHRGTHATGKQAQGRQPIRQRSRQRRVSGVIECA